MGADFNFCFRANFSEVGTYQDTYIFLSKYNYYQTKIVNSINLYIMLIKYMQLACFTLPVKRKNKYLYLSSKM